MIDTIGLGLVFMGSLRLSRDSLSVWQKLGGTIFVYPDRYHSSLVRLIRIVAVLSLAVAVLSVGVQNVFDFESPFLQSLRVEIAGPIFLISLGLLFVLWVRRSVREG